MNLSHRALKMSEIEDLQHFQTFKHCNSTDIAKCICNCNCKMCPSELSNQLKGERERERERETINYLTTYNRQIQS